MTAVVLRNTGRLCRSDCQSESGLCSVRLEALFSRFFWFLNFCLLPPGTLWVTPSSRSACSPVWSPCSTPSLSMRREQRRFTVTSARSPVDSSSTCSRSMTKVCKASSLWQNVRVSNSLADQLFIWIFFNSFLLNICFSILSHMTVNSPLRVLDCWLDKTRRHLKTCL